MTASMPPEKGIKAPVPRTRTGCLTCRKRKVKCDEIKSVCGKCTRLKRICIWAEDIQGAVASTRRRQHSIVSLSNQPLEEPIPSQRFFVEFSTVEPSTLPYIHHFMTVCSRFLVYSNDSEGNPFQEQLMPLSISSPVLLHSMAAVAAGHLARSDQQHRSSAARHYSLALREMSGTLSKPDVARSDATLGACLLMCVYEISHSQNCLWLHHLQGARDLILYRGGPKSSDYLSRFFSLLDVSGSLFAGGGTLIQGNYWLEDEIGSLDSCNGKKPTIPNFPAYDPEGNNVSHYHELMVFMAKMSRFSSDSMDGSLDQFHITEKAASLLVELQTWWRHCPSRIRDQSNDWRTQARPRTLSVPETLEEEGISSIRSRMYGCVLYLAHIIDPLGRHGQPPYVKEAIRGIIDIARETPEGYGLEMGHYFGLFMAGIAVFKDVKTEELLRRKLKADTGVSIYHADRCLELLEVLWARQHHDGVKSDWRKVQIQTGTQVYIFC